LKAALRAGQPLFIDTQETMMKQVEFSAPRTASAAAALAMAFCSAFAAAAPFPTGTFAAEGQSVTIAFDSSGEFRVTEGQSLQVTGRYEVKGGQLDFTDKQGPWACTKADEQTGTYRWSYVHSVLTFSTVTDHCKDRVQSLTGPKWKQKS
jgi:hypothetical protein